ncbi:MAG: hypothetical protein ACD_46C00291G0002 [uncultured bacterium]|nr:MAG: hypothetical protein ACD_46C00291G0002 [uncultured bacterium]
MINLLYNIPCFLLFILICISCITISYLTTRLVHRYISLKQRYDENPAIVCISALIGIIYAILIGFIVLYELNNFNKVDEAENREAKAMFTIFRESYILPETSGAKIRSQLIEYANYVINNEWPMMATGKFTDNTGALMIENISKKIRSFNISKINNPLIIQALNTMSMNANYLFDDHQLRINNIHSTLSSNIWFVLLLSSLLTIGVNCILGMEFRFHIVCIIFLSLMVSGVLYLIVTLDRPYRGDFSIQPDTYKATLDYINLKISS